MMSRLVLPIFLVGMLPVFVAAPAEAAEIYKCKDENGKVIYQNTPCKNAESVEKLDIESERTDPEAIEARAEAREEKLETYSERAREKREEREKAKAERQQKKQQCADARQRLVELNRARRVQDKESGGYLSNEEIAQRRKEAQEAVRKACGN